MITYKSFSLKPKKNICIKCGVKPKIKIKRTNTKSNGNKEILKACFLFLIKRKEWSIAHTLIVADLSNRVTNQGFQGLCS